MNTHSHFNLEAKPSDAANDSTDEEIESYAHHSALVGNVPEVLKRAVREGKGSVKLLYLTDEFLASERIHSLNFTNGHIVSYFPDEDTAADENLDKSRAQVALARWVDLLWQRDADAAARWRTIAAKYVFPFVPAAPYHPWPVVLQYINITRENTWPIVKENRPSWKVKEYWQLAKAQTSRKKDQAVELGLETMAQAFLAHNPPVPSLESFRNITNLSTGALIVPTPAQGATRKGSGGSKGSTRPSGSNADAQALNRLFCLVCHAQGHNHKTCTAELQSNGQPIVLIKGPSGAWALPDRSSICYNFNGTNGCQNGSKCTNGKHCCSGCLATSHSAPKCTA